MVERFNAQNAESVTNIWIQHCSRNQTLIDTEDFILYKPLPSKLSEYNTKLRGKRVHVESKDYSGDQLSKVNLMVKFLGGNLNENPDVAPDIIITEHSEKHWSSNCFSKNNLVKFLSDPNYMPKITNMHIPPMRKVTPDLLSDVHFCIHHTIPEEQEKFLKEIGQKLGATYYWTVGDTITHYIHEGKPLTRQELGLREKYITVVSPLWLIRCYEKNERLSELAFPRELNPNKNLSDIVKVDDRNRTVKKKSKISQKTPVAKSRRSGFPFTPIEMGMTPVSSQNRRESQLIESKSWDDETSISKKKYGVSLKMEKEMHNIDPEHIFIESPIKEGSPIKKISTPTKKEIPLQAVMDHTSYEVNVAADDMELEEEIKDDYDEISNIAKKIESDWGELDLFDESSDSEDFKNSKYDVQFIESQSFTQHEIPELPYVESQNIVPYDPREGKSNFNISDDGMSQVSAFMEGIKIPLDIEEKIKIFQLSGMTEEQSKCPKANLVSLGGEHIDDKYLNPDTTHLIVKQPSASVKFLSACAVGIWILKEEYIIDSLKHGKWLPEEKYEWVRSDDNQKDLWDAPRRWRLQIEKTGMKPFFGWKVFLVAKKKKTAFEQVLRCGGAKILEVNEENLNPILLSESSVYAIIDLDGSEREKSQIRKSAVRCFTRTLITDRISKPKSEWDENDYIYID
eukprot:TRINITY_DN11519_c0_g1_i1.p1 TRINITY_DN11519_c0_g1~~TRINITY_DN11519_c0_g1_i1.p1  ORF type:complete len:683 (-),score=155.35 TRINITY_DN11519_c0_g1_i1:24-2072(-)